MQHIQLKNQTFPSAANWKQYWVNPLQRFLPELLIQSNQINIIHQLSSIIIMSPSIIITMYTNHKHQQQTLLYEDFTFWLCSYQNLELAHVRVDVAEEGSWTSHVGCERCLCQEDKRGDKKKRTLTLKWTYELGEISKYMRMCNVIGDWNKNFTWYSGEVTWIELSWVML